MHPSTRIAKSPNPIIAALMLTCAAAFTASCNSTTESTTNQTEASSTSAATIDEAARNALHAALDDERRAEAFYRAVIGKFGEVLPFSNIVNAEKRHQTLLIPLLEKYGVSAPPNPHDPADFDVPATRAEACDMGARSERDNIALYDRLIPTVRQQDIKSAFQTLRSASADHHLPAFERCAGR